MGVALVALIYAFLWLPSEIPFSVADVEAYNSAFYLANGSLRSWEEGVWTQALLELHNPELTVYARDPFPGGYMPRVPHDFLDTVPGLASASRYIDTNGTLLCFGEGNLNASGHTLRSVERLTGQVRQQIQPR